MDDLKTTRWFYHEWDTGKRETLNASRLLQITRRSKPHEPSVEGYKLHADQSYIATRILFLASTATHHCALYMAAQTIEKYLKSLLMARGQDVSRFGHKLVELAREAGAPFDDEEFVRLCGDLGPFEIAGRYADGHDYVGWQYRIDLLSVLDRFVLMCRQVLIQESPDVLRSRDPIMEVATQDGVTNPLMAAAQQALVHHNRAVIDILRHGSLTPRNL
ncbi:MAG TPA: HEPN domain-containing protein [Dehalococcoidia bacterium]|nr:HEPN domain-containing protein [Dehalococcoidia bacterium]